MIPEFLLELINSVLATPVLLGILLALATFITEDGTLILGSQLIGTHQASPETVTISLIAGILVGDIGLYALGWGARKSKMIRRRIPLKAARSFRRWIEGRETAVLFATRFMPGTRLPTYVSFGFFSLSLTRFCIVMTLASLVWVSGTLFFIKEIQAQLMAIDQTVGIIGGIVVAILFVVVIPGVIKRSQRMEAYSADRVKDAVREDTGTPVGSAPAFKDE